ncbi:MAG: hypothetical protein U9Q70_05440 [Chloroflexota bacterium]|nr:hypothetical protein [Chloroflexota bacterium]
MKLRPPGLLLIGLLLGLTAGLFYTWEVNPVQYYDTSPPLLRRPYRADWIQLVAFAQSYEANLEHAKILLCDLPPEEIQTQLAVALDKAINDGRTLLVLQRLAGLAKEYGVDNLVVQIYTGNQTAELFATPRTATTLTVTPTPRPPTLTPAPTATLDPQQFSIVPTPTPPPSPYTITATTRSCLPTPRIAISLTHRLTITTHGKEELVTRGLPGVDLWLLWTEGADHAVTGLRPAQGLGYADFQVAPEQTYNLYLNQPTGVPLATLPIQPCQTEENAWTAWLLEVAYAPTEH